MIILPTPQSLANALDILRAGGLIGLPTETVYGLAGDAAQDLAVASIFAQKQRPAINPLIIHGASQEILEEHTIWSKKADLLARTFWPGALTLVLPRRPTSPLSLLATAGLDSIAVRIPNHPIALELLRKFGKPLAAPSANFSGKVSPTQSHHVETDFPNLFILEGGDTLIGIESTIIDLTGSVPILLRHGGVPREEIESLIGPLNIQNHGRLKAPGMMKSHYAPSLPLRLNAKEPLEGEAYLAFGHTSYEGKHVLNLSPTGNLTEAAANLFKMLRLLDCASFSGIAVAPIPFKGLGMAINDRLQRAAAPREL